MRIRHLSFAVALLLPFGIVAAASNPGPPPTAFIATTAVESPLVGQAEEMRVQAAIAEQLAAEKVAAEAAENEREAALARAAEVLRAQEAAARTPKTTPTTVRRYTATTVASTPVKDYPSGSMPPKYVSDCESGGNPRAVNPNGHYGKWQFSQATWESVGGTGRPDQASEAEQDYRASILWANGKGAGNWSCY